MDKGIEAMQLRDCAQVQFPDSFTESPWRFIFEFSIFKALPSIATCPPFPTG